MVKINKIYTKTGDDGETHLVGGTRVAKDSLRVMAYGDIDELNSFIGFARTLATEQNIEVLVAQLTEIQNELFDLGSELATAGDQDWEGMIKAQESQTTRLEQWIDELCSGLPELTSFVLPGGTALNSILHIARAVCRRAERSVLTLSREEFVSKPARVYFNRLSDLLFAMARFESHRAGTEEYLWKQGK